MRNDAKAAIFGFVFGIGSTVASMALPQAYPTWPPYVWQLLLWGGLATMVISAVVLGYEFFVRPHLPGRGKRMPLMIMIGCVVAFLASGAWFLVDRADIKELPTKSDPSQPHRAEERPPIPPPLVTGPHSRPSPERAPSLTKPPESDPPEPDRGGHGISVRHGSQTTLIVVGGSFSDNGGAGISVTDKTKTFISGVTADRNMRSGLEVVPDNSPASPQTPTPSDKEPK
jgi:hypothetical protein